MSNINTKWNAPLKLQEDYINCVNECLINEDTFNKFKSLDAYNAVVGMSLPWQSSHFSGEIMKRADIMKHIEALQKNDLIGSPHLDKDQISPNTLRHIYTLCDLTTHFGSLDGLTIAELGVGYGATALMVNTVFKPKAYHLIDLPPVQLFAQKYLNRLGITNCTIDSPPIEGIDLIISEWCLSEFDDEQLYKFYDQYVVNSKNAYLMMNLHDEDRKQKFIHHMNHDFDMVILPEYPRTHWNNYLIIGKK